MARVLGKAPEELDQIADVILRYKPKATTKAKKKRQRKARKAARRQS